MAPEISVIIPVYSEKKYLEECLNSVRQQTLQDIEIICVGENISHELEKLLSEDPRVHCRNSDGHGGRVARWKQGLEVASGTYVLFLEHGATLKEDACRQLYQRASTDNLDMLQFFTESSQNRSLKKKLCNKDIFSIGFLQGKLWGPISGKLYRRTLCMEAFSQIAEEDELDNEDLFVLCCMAYSGKSCFGWNYDPYVQPGQDVVQTPINVMHGLANAYWKIESFCREKGVYDQAESFLEDLRKRWVNTVCRMWFENLPKDQSLSGWESLCLDWGAQPTLSVMADLFFERRKEIATKLAGYPRMDIRTKQVKTVGIYYHKLYSGGIERVISILAPMLWEAGYQVVIITDEAPTEIDYSVPEKIAREMVYSYIKTDHKTIGFRFASWKEITERQNIDLVIYNAWMSNLLLWDVLNLKESGIPVVVYTHGVFSCPISEFEDLFAELPREVHLADGIVTQSETDKLFWDQYSENVHCIPNPSAQSLKNARPASWENHSLIWVGRASPEKQPEKVFEIMEAVVAQMPDVKIQILGDFDHPKWKKIVERKKLENNVIFRGMVSNVSDYLEKSSVYICTSQFEGFLMALVEAQAHKLPAVMFAIPHLTMATPERGVISVDMNDVSSAASEVIKLLEDRQWWQENSDLASKSYQWLRDYDMLRAWRNVLSGIVPDSNRDRKVSIMMDTLISHYDLGCQNRENVNAVTWFIQKIAGGIQCCVENGTGYTLRLAIQKIRTRFDR